MNTETKHADSGCTDYLQHPWESCPENKRTIPAEKPTAHVYTTEQVMQNKLRYAAELERDEARTHADKLAEALRGVIWKCDAHGSWKPTQAEREAMHAALKAYESEVR